MKKIKLSKDQLQKVILSTMGFFFLLYVYFSFFLGPLNRSRNSMLATIADLQGKMGASKSETAKVNNLQRQAGAATNRFAALQARTAEGAPIAWFPPRIKAFLANEHIDRANVRLETNGVFTQPELSGWVNDTWLIDIPGTDFVPLGHAIADLENTEPLFSITKLSIHASAAEPQFQQVTLAVATIFIKR